jgi:hypothetical protein
MSYVLILAALFALMFLLGGVGGLFWWVRRSARYGCQSPGPPLPLFSHDRGALFPRDDAAIDDRTAEVMRARTAWQRE